MQIEIPKPNGKIDQNYIEQLTNILQIFVNATNTEIQALNDKVEKEKR